MRISHVTQTLTLFQNLKNLQKDKTETRPHDQDHMLIQSKLMPGQ